MEKDLDECYENLVRAVDELAKYVRTHPDDDEDEFVYKVTRLAEKVTDASLEYDSNNDD